MAKRIQLASFLAALLLSSVFVAEVHAAGKVFSTEEKAMAKVRTPHQRALITYANRKEYLAIETDFVGRGTDFAYVIPLPSMPEIEEVSPGTFSTLEYLFQPRVTHNVPSYYAGFLCVLIVGWFIWRAFKDNLAALVALTITVIVVYLGILVPSFARPRKEAPSQGVKVEQRQFVGAYETVTLSASDQVELVKWLQRNGYDVPLALRPAIADYVSKGWVFVAVKLRRGRDTTEVSTAPPLAFIFDTKMLVYPMKFTRVDNRDCRVDLYVFGPNSVEADRFEVMASEWLEHPAVQEIYPAKPHEAYKILSPPTAVRIRHPGLKKIVGSASVGTKLSAHLTPHEMKRDIYIDWVPFQEKKEAYYSLRGALTLVLNWCVPVSVFGWLIIAWFHERKHLIMRKATVAGVFVLVLVAFGGFTYFEKLPVINVEMLTAPGRRAYSQQNKIVLRSKEKVADGFQSIEELRAAVKEVAKGEKNLGMGGWLREEDSPGNYIIRKDDRGCHYVWHDMEGGEVLFYTWEAQR